MLKLIDVVRMFIRVTSSVPTHNGGYIINRPRLRQFDDWVCDQYMKRVT